MIRVRPGAGNCRRSPQTGQLDNQNHQRYQREVRGYFDNVLDSLESDQSSRKSH